MVKSSTGTDADFKTTLGLKAETSKALRKLSGKFKFPAITDVREDGDSKKEDRIVSRASEIIFLNRSTRWPSPVALN